MRYLLRPGHHEPRNLWLHREGEPPESKSGHCVGQVFDPAMALQLCDAYNDTRILNAIEALEGQVRENFTDEPVERGYLGALSDLRAELGLTREGS